MKHAVLIEKQPLPMPASAAKPAAAHNGDILIAFHAAALLVGLRKASP
jgi:hypothetical protein